MLLPDEGNGKPVVLLLGEVILARAEWVALSAIAELRVRTSANCQNVIQEG